MNNASDNHYIVGIHAVAAMLEKDAARLRTLWVAREVQKNQRIKRLQSLADKAGVILQGTTNARLDAMVNGAHSKSTSSLTLRAHSKSASSHHQGVVAECDAVASAQMTITLPELLAGLDGPPFLLVLDGVTDPHNLGACLRTADAAGVHAVIVPKDRAVGITSVVSKVACGAAEHVPLIQVTNLSRTLRMLKEEGVWLLGADERGEVPLFEADLKGALALVLGAEGQGLRRLTREQCDLLISVPMAGSVASLNVSVATGVCLFEAVRQRS